MTSPLINTAKKSRQKRKRASPAVLRQVLEEALTTTSQNATIRTNAEMLRLACLRLGQLADRAAAEQQYGKVQVAIVFQHGVADRVVEAAEVSHK